MLKIKHNRGPRPVMQHLNTALAGWFSTIGVYQSTSITSPKRAKIESQITDSESFKEALSKEALKRSQSLITAIKTYRTAPRPQISPLSNSKIISKYGAASLRDFRNKTANKNAQPILVIPSLINSAAILDITPKKSFLKWLDTKNYSPFLLDWGKPEKEEKNFDFTTYLDIILIPAIQKITDITGTEPILIGYCMGGLFTLAAARDTKIKALIQMATPWDFHNGSKTKIENIKLAAKFWQEQAALIPEENLFPLDYIQSIFANLSPMQTPNKFLNFAKMLKNPQKNADKITNFIAIEDWLNEGHGIPLPLAKECLSDLYENNLTAKGKWQIAGNPLNPQKINIPTLVISPKNDNIVPESSATALAEILPNAEILKPNLGHIGLITSSQAKKDCWLHIKKWLDKII